MANFVALDFETADSQRDSACAIGVVRVEGSAITARAVRFIRPPRQAFVFTHIHGITWQRVKDEPSFGAVWRSLLPLLEGATFIAAHNASFDRSVLLRCCEQAGISPPRQPFECTVKLARAAWNLKPTTLPDVCRHLGLTLRDHDPGSDAEACARIVIAARGRRRTI